MERSKESAHTVSISISIFFILLSRNLKKNYNDTKERRQLEIIDNLIRLFHTYVLHTCSSQK